MPKKLTKAVADDLKVEKFDQNKRRTYEESFRLATDFCFKLGLHRIRFSMTNENFGDEFAISLEAGYVKQAVELFPEFFPTDKKAIKFGKTVYFKYRLKMENGKYPADVATSDYIVEKPTDKPDEIVIPQAVAEKVADTSNDDFDEWTKAFADDK